MPTAIHFTLEGHHAWWSRTEFSASFDWLSYHQVNHFGDRAALPATCVFRDGDRLDMAVDPQLTYLLRGDSGMRAGATAIARFAAGRGSAGVTFTWTGASSFTPTNPAGTFAFTGIRKIRRAHGLRCTMMRAVVQAQRNTRQRSPTFPPGRPLFFAQSMVTA